MEEPTLQIDSFLELLNSESPIIEKLTQKLTKTSTYIISSTDNILSTDNSQSMDISHPLITQILIDNFSLMDIHQSMDTPSPTDIIAQTLLGLREGSDYESEGQGS